MTAKHKPKQINTTYFSEARSYEKVVTAEVDFFKGLVAAKNQIPANPSIRKTIGQVTGFIQDRGMRPLNIMLEFAVRDPRSNKEHTLLLGTLFQPPQPASHAQVTHFLCLTDDENVLAKVHADFDFNPEADEKKPSPHVQMGGRAFDAIIKCKQNKELKVSWDEGIDKPRLPSIPLCTALLWHWAFLEYRNNENIVPILNAFQWKQLVKKAESAVLRPFFEDGMKLLDRHPEDGLLNSLYIPLAK